MYVYMRICEERKEDRSREKPVVGKAKSAQRKSYVRVPGDAERIIREKYFNNLAHGYLYNGNILIILQMHTNIGQKKLR